MKAIYRNTVIAESDKTVMVEGNHYFPMDSIKKEYLEDSDYRTTCPWKGEAHYFHVKVEGNQSQDAAWTYPEPKEAAAEIKNHVAFWKDVEVVE